jgi:hypothetical protein
MMRRSSVRAQTDLPVAVYADGFVFDCRATDISTSGVVIERARGLDSHEARPFYWLKFSIGAEGVLALARPVWNRGRTQALKIVEIAECDRLSIAEHMDSCSRQGMVLH